MTEITLESLARRVEALEAALGSSHAPRPAKDWREAVGMFGDSEFMRQVDEEGRRIREAEREAAPRAGRGMILVDTDHASHLKYPASEPGRRLFERLDAVPRAVVVGVSIVSVEEQMRGWLAAIAKERLAIRQVFAYRELSRLFEFYQKFEVVPFDDYAARQFDALLAHRLRIGTMDLKIAATALIHDALLLSANRSDFGRVPGLRVENWLD